MITTASLTQLQQAMALHQSGQLQPAQRLYQSVLNDEPNNFDALHLLGVVAFQTQQHALAVELIGKAISLHANAAFYSNLGNAQAALGQQQDAVASFDNAIRLKPDYADAYSNRGNALKALDQLHEALADYDHAIALKPDLADAWFNRGNALRELGQLETAIVSFDRAIALNPDRAAAWWNKALALLSLGDFAQGWPLYEWRWQTEPLASRKRTFSQPLWSGKEALLGKTILLHHEQGLGDTLQFCRFANQVAALGARVFIEVPASLAALLRTLVGVSGVIEQGNALPEFDFHCPLLSLPLALGTDLNSLAGAHAYLFADPVKCEQWAKILGKKTRPRIGLVWSGKAVPWYVHNRSIALAELLAQLPADYQYISLQNEFRESDLPALPMFPHLLQFGAALKDFSDTAALCSHMDLIISIDTSVAHLAGALGKPTWILLPFNADWRWLRERNDCPWYGSAKLYRQTRRDDWTNVLAALSKDLMNR